MTVINNLFAPAKMRNSIKYGFVKVKHNGPVVIFLGAWVTKIIMSNLGRRCSRRRYLHTFQRISASSVSRWCVPFVWFFSIRNGNCWFTFVDVHESWMMRRIICSNSRVGRRQITSKYNSLEKMPILEAFPNASRPLTRPYFYPNRSNLKFKRSTRR